MKLLCYLTSLTLLVTVQAITLEQVEVLAKFTLKCQSQIGVSQEVIQRLRNDEWVDDPKAKQLFLCFFKKIGLATESGEMVIDVWRSKLRKVTVNDEEADQIVKECVVKKDTPEETAFNAGKCVEEKKPTVILFD